jgi:hypothetical protein
MPAITDVDAIHILQNSLRNLSIEDTEAPKLWDRAAAARPSDHDLLASWLDGCIADSDWKGAQKVRSLSCHSSHSLFESTTPFLQIEGASRD